MENEKDDTRVNILGQDTQRNAAGMRRPEEQTTDDLRSRRWAHSSEPVNKGSVDPHKEGLAKNTETGSRE